MIADLIVLPLFGLAIAAGLTAIARRYPKDETSVADAVNELLPQTQCAQCGHPGCRPYAEAIANGEAINRCPPGGEKTIQALADLLGKPVIPLDESFGVEQPKRVAKIREPECIGCTLCIQACPVDAIIGAGQQMHVVIPELCTGCDLCLEPCPVDCIDMLEVEVAETVIPRHITRDIKGAEEMPCIRCGECEPVCPKRLIPNELFWHKGSSERMEQLNLDACIECRICDRACPSHIPLTKYFVETKQRIQQEKIEAAEAKEAEIRFKRHEARKNQKAEVVKTRSNKADRSALLAKLKKG